ncbi:hypothetical protein QTP88_017136 [Uroleucon formosanum]
MVVRCAASICFNIQDKTKDITYHKFPKNVELCNKWATLCHHFDLIDNKSGKCNKSQRLCSIHFEPDCYLSSGNIRKDAIPSKFYWTVPSSLSDTQKDTSSTNICEISAQNIDEENVLDLPDPECSAGIAVCSTPTLGRTYFNTEMTNISNISRVTCTSPTTEMSTFVKLQSKLINFKNQGCRYTDEFKQFALTIWFFGPKVYRFLKSAWCLPTIRTLQRVSERWEINAGFNNFVFEILKLKLKIMSDESKQCVMCIDEMSLKSFVYYHIKKDVIHGLHDTGFIKTDELVKSVMVIMIRGNANCIDDLDGVLANLTEASISKVNVLITGNNPIINVPALPVENTTYKNLELPEQNVFTYFCGFLLSKCLSLFTLASLMLTPAQKLKLKKNFANTISVDVRICCTLLSELIKSNDQPQFFDPLGDRRHMFEKHSQTHLTYYDVTHTAVLFGHIDCLKMAHELGFPLHMTDDELYLDDFRICDIQYSKIGWKRGISSKAAYFGNLTCLKYAHRQGIPWDVSTCTAAALGANYDCLKYAVENGCPINESGPINLVAEKGNLLFLKYLHEQGCPWSEETSMYAILGGNLKCLEYIHANGCPWSESTCYEAVNSKNFECLKFVVENGCPLTENAINLAAVDNLLFLKYLHEHGCPWSVETCAAATVDLDCLRYLHANGCPWDVSTCTMAIENDEFDSLKFAVENGCPLDVPEPANEAASEDNLLILKYLHEHGCPWSVETFAYAAASSINLDCVKYLHANGCPWDVSTCTNAVTNQNFSCLEFVVDNGCPLDTPQPTLEAASIGNLTILKYLHEHGCPWSVETFACAALKGDLNCLKYLHANGCPWDVSTCTNAVTNQNFSCLEFLVDNGCPLDTPQPALKAASIGNLTILKYLHERGCPWIAETCTLAASEGDIEYLKHARAKGCPWNTRTLGKPLMYMYEVCLKFIYRNGCEWDISVCIEAMGKYKQPECIDYAWRNGCPLRIGTCYAGSGDGRMDCLLSEPDHNCKWDHEIYHDYVAVIRKTSVISSAHITALLINSLLE